MREIKFRAWFTRDKTYIKPMTIQNMIHQKVSTFSLSVLYNEVIFEQYTGINDRVGNSIYENDIVEMDYHKGDHTILDPQTLGMVEQYSDIDTIVRGVVHIWPSTGVIITRISSENPEQFVGDYRIPQYLHINKHCVVVGNIHKNQDLLEEQS